MVFLDAESNFTLDQKYSYSWGGIEGTIGT